MIALPSGGVPVTIKAQARKGVDFVRRPIPESGTRVTWKRNRSCWAPIRSVCHKQTFSVCDFQDDFLESPSGPDEKSFLVSFKFIASNSLPEPV